MTREGNAPPAEDFWVGIDWGTTNIRACLMDAKGAVASERSLGIHIKDCAAEGWKQVLARLMTGWPVGYETAIVACGMAGSKFGWLEAPYAECPVAVGDLMDKAVRPPDAPNVLLLPGLSCDDKRGNHDVIRGEETQLLGLFEITNLRSGIICAPGTHTKWIDVDKATIRGFYTTMTGELFGLLREHSILVQSVSRGEDDPNRVGDGFRRGVELADTGDGVLADLFKVRTGDLFNTLAKEDAADFLSGILVGADVRQLLHIMGRPASPVPLVGPRPLSERYREALQFFDVESIILDADEVTIAGLTCVARQLGIAEAAHGE